jgi:acyl-CoA synthetase (AMP-forming)/AMP-acid ligase II
MYPGTWASKEPNRPAIVMVESGETVTYGELDALSNRIAHYLRSLGLRTGDHVALVSENHPRFLAACWAAQRTGLYYTPINWHLTPGEMAYILQDCQAQVLFGTQRHAELLQEVIAAHPNPLTCVALVGEVDGFVPLQAAIEKMSDAAPADETSGEDMIYTSGTSGRPKGGLRPLSGLAPGEVDEGLAGFGALFGLDQTSRYLTPGAPLYHAAPLRFAMLVNRLGGTNVVMERFDPGSALQAIATHRVTHSQWVPTMFVRLLQLPAQERESVDLSSHVVAVHSAAPCPKNIKRQMLDWWGPVVHEYYGASEGGAITYISPHEWLQRPGSVGRAIVGVVHVVDELGNELPPGEVGQIYTENGRPIEYHNDPAKSAGAHDAHGWSTVGDMGHLDADGYLFMADRRDDLIISGGVNIYPREVEDALAQHPTVADVAVIGVLNEEFGQEVKAVVQLTPATDATPALTETLLAYCRSELAGFKCPRSIDFVAELPRTPTGKLLRRVLREQYMPASS